MTKISNQYSLTNILTADLANSRLGINNVSPTVALDVTGAGKFSSSVTAASYIASNTLDGDPQLGVFTNASTGTSAEATIYIRNGTTSNDATFVQTIGTNFTTTGGFVQDGGVVGTGTSLAGGLSLMVRANADMRFYTNGHTNERMRITSTGNVGIGTTSPSNKLEVIGASGVDNFILSGGGVGATLGGFKFGNGTGVYGSLYFSNVTNDVTLFQQYVSGNLILGTNTTERMRITSGGNVGIGTSVTSAGKVVISGNYAGSTTNTQLVINTISSQVSLESLDIVANVNKRFTIYSSDMRLAALGSGTVSSNVDGVLSGSDGRLKNKTRLLENGLSKVLQLVPTYYKWKEDSPFYTKEDYEELGFIAQEVSSIIPEASPEPEGHKVKNYHDRAIIAVLVKAIQELSAKVSLLENK